MANHGTLVFKEDLGWFPLHLGCNALAVHPNCIICNRDAYLAYLAQKG